MGKYYKFKDMHGEMKKVEEVNNREEMVKNLPMGKKPGIFGPLGGVGFVLLGPLLKSLSFPNPKSNQKHVFHQKTHKICLQYIIFDMCI